MEGLIRGSPPEEPDVLGLPTGPSHPAGGDGGSLEDGRPLVVGMSEAHWPMAESLQELVAALADRLERSLGCELVLVARHLDYGLEIVAAAGACRVPPGSRLPADDDVADALARGVAHVVRDVPRDRGGTSRALRARGLGAYVLVPLGAGRGRREVAVLGWRDPRTAHLRTSIDVRRIEELVASAALQLHGLLVAEQHERDARRLRAMLDVRDEMIEMITHDLAAPVGVVSGFARLLESRQCGPEQGRQWLNAIVRNAGDLEALVEDLRAVVCMDADALRVQSETFDLAGVATEMVDDLLLGSGRVVHLHTSVATAVGDPALTRRILKNLLVNAHKYSPVDEPIEVEAGTEDQLAFVAVRDRGPGIPPERRDELFRRFGRLHLEGQVNVPGTGLGLYICRRLAQAQGGTVELDDDHTPGSAFRLRLPTP